MNTIWILGATGRSGRAIAEQLAVSHDDLVLVSRDAMRLRAVASGIAGAPRTLVAGGVGAAFGALATGRILLKPCEVKPPAERVRADAIASVNSDYPVTAQGLAYPAAAGTTDAS